MAWGEFLNLYEVNCLIAKVIGDIFLTRLLQFNKLTYVIHLAQRKISIKGRYYLGSAVSFMSHKLDSFFCPNQAKHVLKSEMAVICVPTLHPKGICIIQSSLHLKPIFFIALTHFVIILLAYFLYPSQDS